jgi:hypothetical protein
MKHLLLMLVCAGGLAVAGCGSDSADSDDDGDDADQDGDDADDDGDGAEELVVDAEAEECKAGDSPTYDNFAKAFVMTSCLTCHTSSKTTLTERLQAPLDINFDTQDEIKAKAHDAYHEVVVEKSMPVGGGVEQTDRDKFGIWLRCDAP